MDIIINEINTDSISIDDINFKPITNRLPSVPQVYQTQPVVVNIGVPVINMPGCVEAHEQNKKDNFAINVEDPKGVKVFCDAGTPSYNPMDYDKKNLDFSSEAPVPAYKGSETNPPTDTKAPGTPPPPTPPPPPPYPNFSLVPQLPNFSFVPQLPKFSIGFLDTFNSISVNTNTRTHHKNTDTLFNQARTLQGIPPLAVPTTMQLIVYTLTVIGSNITKNDRALSGRLYFCVGFSGSLTGKKNAKESKA